MSLSLVPEWNLLIPAQARRNETGWCALIGVVATWSSLGCGLGAAAAGQGGRLRHALQVTANLFHLLILAIGSYCITQRALLSLLQRGVVPRVPARVKIEFL